MSRVQSAAHVGRQALVGARVLRLRRAAGLSQEELALFARLAPGQISMLENGRAPLDSQLIESLAGALNCSPGYLLLDSEEPEATRPWLRAYADAPKKVVDRAIADSATAIDLLNRTGIARRRDLLPQFVGDLEDDGQIEAFAAEVRAAAEITDATVIGNVMRSAERLGCVVLPLEDELGRHLGLSLRIDETPVIRVARGSLDPDRTVPGDRQRFTVAHELGHLSLHHATSAPDTPEQAARIERQAHRFAGAYLTPADPLVEHLESLGGRVTLRTLAELKATWGVAIKMLVLRFRQLGVIGDDHARSLYKQISARRWNKAEPVEVGNETAVWLSGALRKAYGDSGDAILVVSRDVGLDARFVRAWCQWEPSQDYSRDDSNVLAFPGARSRHTNSEDR